MDLGIPSWLTHPLEFERDLQQGQCPIDAPELHLSPGMRERLAAWGAGTVFPVQRAVIRTVLGGYVPEESKKEGGGGRKSKLNDGKEKTKKKRKRQEAQDESGSGSNSMTPWHRLHLNQPLHTNTHNATTPNDLLISAPTGSGKTLAYVLPIIESLRTRLHPRLRALIVVPTRDLVRQVKKTMDHFVVGTSLRVVGIEGGRGMASGETRDQLVPEQMKLVESWDGESTHPGGKTCVDILITTPGRLMDHLIHTPGFTLQHVQWLVMDEADRLLNQHYNHWLSAVLDAMDRSLDTVSTDPRANYLCSVRSHPERAYARDGERPRPPLPLPSTGVRDPLLSLSARTGFHPPIPVTPLRKLLFSATLTRHPGKLASLRLDRPGFLSARRVAGELDLDVDEVDMDRSMVNHQDNEEDQEHQRDQSATPQQPAHQQPSEDDQPHYDNILPSTLKQQYLVCHDASEKPLLLLTLVLQSERKGILCFTKSIEHAVDLHRILHQYACMFPRGVGHSGSDGNSGSSSGGSDGNSGSGNNGNSNGGDGGESNTTNTTHPTTTNPLRIEYYASSKPPSERTKLIQHFNRGLIDLLICTDGLSRGMDLDLHGDGINTIHSIDHSTNNSPPTNNNNNNSNNNNNNIGIPMVIHYDPPSTHQTYIHRSGRTARAGRPGTVLSLLSPTECHHWKKMMRQYGWYHQQERLSMYRMEECGVYQVCRRGYLECLAYLRRREGKDRKDGDGRDGKDGRDGRDGIRRR